MRMRLSVQDVGDVAFGGAIPGIGGGGGPYVGKLLAQRAIEEYGSPEMIPLQEIPDNNIVMIASWIGALRVLVEKILRGEEKLAIGTYVLGAGSWESTPIEQIDWRDFAIAASETSRVVATHLLFPGLHAK